MQQWCCEEINMNYEDMNLGMGEGASPSEWDDVFKDEVWAPPNVDFCKGGEDGLTSIMAAKMAADLAELRRLLSAVLREIEAVASPDRKPKRGFRRRLKKAILADLRDAGVILHYIATPLTLRIGSCLRPDDLPIYTPWERLGSVLAHMHSEHRWPSETNLLPWLNDEVLPLLRFAVHGEPLPSVMAEAWEKKRDWFAS
jgi:hypothetical protein